MLWTIVSGLIFVSGLLILPGMGYRSAPGTGYDLLICNGQVIDGTGNPAFQADVAVRDGYFVAVSRNVGGEAQVVIEARGKVVAPGRLPERLQITIHEILELFELDVRASAVTSPSGLYDTKLIQNHPVPAPKTRPPRPLGFGSMPHHACGLQLLKVI